MNFLARVLLFKPFMESSHISLGKITSKSDTTKTRRVHLNLKDLHLPSCVADALLCKKWLQGKKLGKLRVDILIEHYKNEVDKALASIVQKLCSNEITRKVGEPLESNMKFVSMGNTLTNVTTKLSTNCGAIPLFLLFKKKFMLTFPIHETELVKRRYYLKVLTLVTGMSYFTATTKNRS